MNFNLDWGFTLAVVVVGIVVVFAVLLILVALCSLMGVAFKAVEKNKNDKKSNGDDKKVQAESVKAAPAVTKAVVAPASQPTIQSGITGDVVAAISAALACVMGPDTKFAVKSIKRSRNSRSTWNAAGIAENTQPF